MGERRSVNPDVPAWTGNVPGVIPARAERSMRLWHLLFGVAVVAALLCIGREPAGIVFLVVFSTALGEVVFGLTAVMALFQTVGAIGEAKGLYEHLEALTATTIVLALGTAAMSACLFAGFWLIERLV